MGQHTTRTDTDGDRTGKAAGRSEHPGASTAPEHLDRRGALRLGATAGLGITALSLPVAAAAVSVDPEAQTAPSHVVDANGTIGTDGVTHLTIQSAVDDAIIGDEILVRPGTYAENVTIPTGKQGLILRGPNASVTGSGARSDEAVIAPASGTALTVTSAGVQVSGFTIDPAGAGNGVQLNSSATGARIINSRIVGPADTTALPSAAYDAFADRGVVFSGFAATNGPDVDVEFRGNLITGWRTGVFNQKTTGVTYDGNHFLRNRSATAADDLGSVTHVRNHYEENYRTCGMGPRSIGPFRLEDNLFEGNVRGPNIDVGTAALTGDTPGHVIRGNRFLDGNAATDGQIVTGGPGDVDVTENWWGTDAGPSEGAFRRAGTATEANAAFVFSPWCADAACTSTTAGT
jgi:hypothetical protein